jgi:PmbA protein
MDEREALDIARNVVAMAVAGGATEAEAIVSTTRRFHVEARAAAIAKLEQSTAKSLHLRVFAGGRRATLSTSDFTPDGLRDAIPRAIEQAAFVEVDEFARLPDTFASDVPDLELFDERLAGRDDAEKVDEALVMERLVREADPRILNSNGSHANDGVSLIAMANSAGFSGSYRSTRASRSSAPVANADDVRRTGHYGTSGRHLADLEDPATVARIAARRSVEMFGARKPDTMRVPVIFERDVAAGLLEDLFAAIDAANVAVGNSWLIGKVGERIGSEAVTIVDDGRLRGKLGSGPFDGEGVATRRTPVFERGVLATFLYDTYYGRKLGAASTGNSTGNGIGPNNFYLEPGRQSLDELIAATPRGILVLDTIGFATEHASGTYSRGAHGFYIENGELAYPVDEFTIAGRFTEMLASIDAVADDLRFDSAVASPSFRVGEMTVSGN